MLRRLNWLNSSIPVLFLRIPLVLLTKAIYLSFLPFHPICLCLTPRDLSLRKVSSLFPTLGQLTCSPSRKIPKPFSAIYVSKLIFTISPPPIIIRIFLNKTILKSLPGLHLKANFRLLIVLSDNVATILTN